MLIELAIAALVIGLGILALLALGHVGGRAASDVEDETRAAMFADDVFASLRVFSDHYSRGTNELAWLEFWGGLADGRISLPAAALGAWDNDPATGQRPAIMGDRQVHTNLFLGSAGMRPGTTLSIPEYGLQYRLAIDTNRQPRVAWATLHVWSGGRRGNTDPFVFYTHFADSGGLP